MVDVDIEAFLRCQPLTWTLTAPFGVSIDVDTKAFLQCQPLM